MKRLTALAALTTLLLASAAPATAQTQASATQNTTSQREASNPVATLVAQLGDLAFRIGLVSLRSVVDLTYDDMTVSPDGGVTLYGLTLRLPDVVDGTERRCLVTVERADLRVVPAAILLLAEPETRMSARDVTIGPACLPVQGRDLLRAMDLPSVTVSALDIDSRYEAGPGRVKLNLRAALRDIADIEATGRLNYVSLREVGRREIVLDDNGEGYSNTPRTNRSEPRPYRGPTAQLGPVDIAVADRGGLERLRPLLGTLGVTPEAAGQATEGFLGQIGLTEQAPRAAAEVRRFMSEGGRLIVSLRPQGEVWIDEIANLPPPQIAAQLDPIIGAAPRRPQVSPALLAAFDAAQPDAAQSLMIARALGTGEGAPRDVEAALTRLAPLYEAGNVEAITLTVELLTADVERRVRRAGRGANRTSARAAEAYAAALDLAGRGGSSAVPLDRMEAFLDAGTVRRLQDEATRAYLARINAPGMGSDTGSDTGSGRGPQVDEMIARGDLQAMLDLARSLAEGRGVPRDYGAALTFALVAEAGGEIGADVLVERIERAMAAPAWEPDLTKARTNASRLWFDRVAPVLARESR